MHKLCKAKGNPEVAQTILKVRVCVSAQPACRVKKSVKYGRRLFRSTNILVPAFEPC